MQNKRSTALVLTIFTLLLFSSFVHATNEGEYNNFQVLVGSGLLKPQEANVVLKAENISSYELANIVGRAWKRITGNQIDNSYSPIVVNFPDLLGQMKEVQTRCPEISLEAMESLMELTLKYKSELNDLGYGFYFGNFAVYQEKNQVSLYSLWNIEGEMAQLLAEMVKPFVASYTDELTNWVRFRLEYVALSQLNKKELVGEIQLGQLGQISIGGAVSTETQPYRFQAAWKVGPVELGAEYNNRKVWMGSKPFEIPELGFSVKLGEVELASYWDTPLYSYINQDGEKVYIPNPEQSVPRDGKEQIELPQVTSLVVGIPIWQWATLRAGLLYGEVKDEEKGMATTKGATAGIKIDLSQASIEADYQYYNRENEKESNTANLKLGYGISDSTYINLAYRLVTSTEKNTGKTADENLATAEISIQF